MVFLPGDHTLDTNITVANVTRLTMHGESSSGRIPTVVCNGPVGFSFTSMVDFRVHSLLFTACSRDFSDPLASKYALLLDMIEVAELVNCSFHDNLGTALVVMNTNIILAGNTDFKHNHCEDDYCVGGGGIAANSSNLTFIGDTMFIENNATFGIDATHGAAGIDVINCSLTSTGNIHFVNNTNTYFIGYSNLFGPPGAIWASASSLHFTGSNNFISNSANIGIAGAIAVTNTSLSFTGSNTFNYNSGLYGGAIYAECDSVLSFSGTNTFIGNSARYYGSAIIASGSKSVNVTGTNIFNNNSAPYCGAIATFPLSPTSPQFFCDVADTYTVFDLTGTNNFSNNSAEGFGGAICTFDNTSLSLSGTSNLNSCNGGAQGGAIYARNSMQTLIGTVSFTNNEANNTYVGGETQGGAIFARNAMLTLIGTVSFTNNEANVGGETQGGAIYARNSMLTLNGTISFTNNEANNTYVGGETQGGAIFAFDTILTLNGTVSFTNNKVVGSGTGGGLYLVNSTLSILSNTTVYWEHNHASLGGAIYVDDSSNPFIYCTQVEKCTPNDCFFQLPGQNLSTGLDVQLIFKNNSADAAGSVLYGGEVDNCRLTGLDSYSSGKVFDMIAHIEDENTTSIISSYAFHICHCENSLPDCSKSCPYTFYIPW